MAWYLVKHRDFTFTLYRSTENYRELYAMPFESNSKRHSEVCITNLRKSQGLLTRSQNKTE